MVVAYRRLLPEYELSSDGKKTTRRPLTHAEAEAVSYAWESGYRMVSSSEASILSAWEKYLDCCRRGAAVRFNRYRSAYLFGAECWKRGVRWKKS